MRTYKLLTWNIGFAGGIHGLKGCIGKKSDVMARLSGMAEVLSKAAADVVFLQEIDRCSKRSFYVDQVRYLATQAGYPYQAFVQTWRSCWIPYPMTWRLDRQFGPMDAGQVILSKHPIVWHAHITHEKPRSRRGLFRYFYLDRVSQIVGIAMSDTQGRARIHPFCHVHFEAFDRATRVSQAQALTSWVASWSEPLSDLVVLGDFNAISQETGPFVFSDDPEVNYENDATLDVFLSQGYQPAGIGDVYRDFPSPAPNRQLTYLMGRPGVRLTGYHVLQTGDLSDHFPGVGWVDQ